MSHWPCTWPTQVQSPAYRVPRAWAEVTPECRVKSKPRAWAGVTHFLPHPNIKAIETLVKEGVGESKVKEVRMVLERYFGRNTVCLHIQESLEA